MSKVRKRSNGSKSGRRVVRPAARILEQARDRLTDAQQEMVDDLREFKKRTGKAGRLSEAEFEEFTKERYEREMREGMRSRAFAEMPVWMFEAMEDMIRERVEEAASYFGDKDGRIKENRLREVANLLIEAAALSTSLLQCGECLR